MRAVKQSTARTIMVYMVRSDDHVTGMPGLTLSVSASKAGGAFATITPTVTDRGSGWYSIALTAAHTDTLGDLAIMCTATGADPALVLLDVVAYDPADAMRLGLSALPNAAAASAGGIITSGSGAHQLIVSSGVASATIAAGGITSSSFAADAITAAAIAADAITASELATSAADEIADAVRSELTTELARIDVAVSTRATSTAITDVRKLVEADLVVDTAPNPWELVWIEKGTGPLGTGTELMRKKLYDVAGTGLTAQTTIVGGML